MNIDRQICSLTIIQQTKAICQCEFVEWRQRTENNRIMYRANTRKSSPNTNPAPFASFNCLENFSIHCLLFVRCLVLQQNNNKNGCRFALTANLLNFRLFGVLHYTIKWWVVWCMKTFFVYSTYIKRYIHCKYTKICLVKEKKINSGFSTAWLLLLHVKRSKNIQALL